MARRPDRDSPPPFPWPPPRDEVKAMAALDRECNGGAALSYVEWRGAAACEADDDGVARVAAVYEPVGPRQRRLLGCAAWVRRGAEWELLTVAVEKSYRRCGVGLRLVNCNALAGDCFADVDEYAIEAQRFFKAAGWHGEPRGDRIRFRTNLDAVDDAEPPAKAKPKRKRRPPRQPQPAEVTK